MGFKTAIVLLIVLFLKCIACLRKGGGMYGDSR